MTVKQNPTAETAAAKLKRRVPIETHILVIILILIFIVRFADHQAWIRTRRFNRAKVIPC